ncbi:hypothetical protein [Parvimonas micra]|uniref:TcdC n=1 Tax=Parvimonas micra TaxID=33033 RepID=A0AAX3K5B5_9FIRM|nr:hypothetical protein [Parvimonas micra]WBB30405.1 hypothetical protein NM222_05350 [Parvimonas micra]
MENKNLENCKNEESEEIINDSENEIEISRDKGINSEESNVVKESDTSQEEKVLDESEKVIKELQNKNSFLYKLFGVVVFGFILALFIFNGVRNISMEKKATEIYRKYKDEIDKANNNYKKIEAEYANYKEKMKPYENMQLADKEKKEAELKAEREKKEAEEKAKKEAEEKAKKEEEAKGYETGITYEELARNPDKNKGKKVTFTGTVIQVIRGDGEDQFRVQVKDDYKKIIFVTYITKDGENKILENDKVIIRGISIGEITYDSTMGGKISIPGIEAHSIEIK